jgi:excisionase family DNA binding protein
LKATKIQVTDREIMNVPEASEFLRVSESIIRRLIKERRIPFFQIEGRYLFYKPKLEAWINTITINPATSEENPQAEKLADAIWERKEVKQ